MSQGGRFLKDVEDFDAVLYGVSLSEAAVLDPQQRLILEVRFPCAGCDVDIWPSQ
jgi:acyl transferase domain-containing protein